jgi:hypothetical protein
VKLSTAMKPAKQAAIAWLATRTSDPDMTHSTLRQKVPT